VAACGTMRPLDPSWEVGSGRKPSGEADYRA
jgi:hypothetical protein